MNAPGHAVMVSYVCVQLCSLVIERLWVSKQPQCRICYNAYIAFQSAVQCGIEDEECWRNRYVEISAASPSIGGNRVVKQEL